MLVWLANRHCRRFLDYRLAPHSGSVRIFDIWLKSFHDTFSGHQLSVVSIRHLGREFIVMFDASQRIIVVQLL